MKAKLIIKNSDKATVGVRRDFANWLRVKADEFENDNTLVGKELKASYKYESKIGFNRN